MKQHANLANKLLYTHLQIAVLDSKVALKEHCRGFLHSIDNGFKSV